MYRDNNNISVVKYSNINQTSLLFTTVTLQSNL